MQGDAGALRGFAQAANGMRTAMEADEDEDEDDEDDEEGGRLDCHGTLAPSPGPCIVKHLLRMLSSD